MKLYVERALSAQGRIARKATSRRQSIPSFAR